MMMMMMMMETKKARNGKMSKRYAEIRQLKNETATIIAVHSHK